MRNCLDRHFVLGSKRNKKVDWGGYWYMLAAGHWEYGHEQEQEQEQERESGGKRDNGRIWVAG
jgi:hypothetical protein